MFSMVSSAGYADQHSLKIRPAVKDNTASAFFTHRQNRGFSYFELHIGYSMQSIITALILSSKRDERHYIGGSTSHSVGVYYKS